MRFGIEMKLLQKSEKREEYLSGYMLECGVGKNMGKLQEWISRIKIKSHGQN